MNVKIFRKKTIDKLSSPEQLTDYIRVSSPSMWLVLIAIIFLLSGACIWGIFGRLNSTMETAAVSEGDRLFCCIGESEAEKVKEGMEVTVNGNKYTIVKISSQPVQVPDNSLLLHYSNLNEGEWMYTADLDGNEPEGTYNATIVVESIAPMKFAVN